MNVLESFDLSAAHSIPTEVSPNLDPRLQWWIASLRAGSMKQASTSTRRDEVAVIAKVTDAGQWAALSEVRSPSLIGTSGAYSIVTGRIPISRAESVRGQAFVKSLKASQDLQPNLDQSTNETEARPHQLPSGTLSQGGQGAVVGIIDYGGDFAHENFKLDGGTTRILALWNQNASASSSSPFGYGREYSAAEINLALQTSNPYSALSYDPADYEDPGDPGSHGTHVMDIAAGNGRGTAIPGLAPSADLIFVNISHAADPSGTSVVGKSFGDSVRLLEAAKYIFDKAGNKPCVVNISLGTNGGPHDGTTLVEQGLDSLVSAQANRAIVLAASNSFDDGIHATGTVPQGGQRDIRWQLLAIPARSLELELWYPGADRFTVELIDSAGVSRATVPPGQNKTLQIGTKVVFIANRLADPNNGDNMIGVFLANGISPGTYTIRLHGDTVTNGVFHAWIERDNAFPSRFAPPHDNSLTIGSISCGHQCISVGSYDAHKAAKPISWFSSAGPTRDGRQKPELSAPGHDVLAALSSSGTGSRQMSGTSMAAPAVAGIIALMYAEAKARGIDLTITQVREILIDTARRTPPSGNAWHPQFGHGRVHAQAAVQAVIDLAGHLGAPASNGATPKKPAKAKPKVPRKPKGASKQKPK